MLDSGFEEHMESCWRIGSAGRKADRVIVGNHQRKPLYMYCFDWDSTADPKADRVIVGNQQRKLLCMHCFGRYSTADDMAGMDMKDGSRQPCLMVQN